WATVGQRPIAVNERITDLAVFSAREVSPLGKPSQVALQLCAQARLRGAIVVQVKLYFSETRVDQVLQFVEKLRAILLPREKKGVLRTSTVRVEKPLCHVGITLSPRFDSFETYRLVSSTPQRFIVIAYGKQEMPNASRWRHHLAHRRLGHVTRV